MCSSDLDSLGNMRVLDLWRRAIGLAFDQDREDGE